MAGEDFGDIARLCPLLFCAPRERSVGWFPRSTPQPSPMITEASLLPLSYLSVRVGPLRAELVYLDGVELYA